MEDRKKLKIILFLFSGLVIVGTLGYMILLRISFISALYMTVITISTVGYKEVAMMTEAAQIFSIFLIFFGVGTVGYTFTTVLVMFIDGRLQDIWRDRKMESAIKALENHYIICGAGASGRAIISDFIRHDMPFLIIDQDEDKCIKLRDEGLLVICGDATSEDVLQKAKVFEAKGLLSCLPTDMENIMVILTAKEISKDIYIISRAITPGSHEKLTKVGADNTISISEIGGKRMAGMMIRPHIISFLDVITRVGNVSLDLEEVKVPVGSMMANKKLLELEIPKKTGLIVLAVKHEDSDALNFNPSGNYMIKERDILIVLGKQEQVDILINLVKESV
ncbi:MAG: potassium channel protein [Tissierellia bacterium]|nr:potassium channel protein [Tissierellia bacterium]